MKLIRFLFALGASVFLTLVYAWFKQDGAGAGVDGLLTVLDGQFGVQVSPGIELVNQTLVLKQVVIFTTFLLTTWSILRTEDARKHAEKIAKQVSSALSQMEPGRTWYLVSEDRSKTPDRDEAGGEIERQRVAELSAHLLQSSSVNPLVVEDLASVCEKFDSTISISESIDALKRIKDRWASDCLAQMIVPQFSKVTLPLIGFAGTIFGIMGAMNELEGVVQSSQPGATSGSPDLAQAMIPLIQQIGVAFDTTLIALFGTAILIYRVGSARTGIAVCLEKACHVVEKRMINSFKLPQLGKTIDEVLERIALGAYLKYNKAKMESIAIMDGKLDPLGQGGDG